MENAGVSSKIFLDSRFVSKSEAKISIFDRGVLFSDSVYENIPSYYGKLRKLNCHIGRLQKSLNCLSIPFNCSELDWEKIIRQIIKSNESDFQSVYIQVTRGSNKKRSHTDMENIKPTIFIFSQSLQPLKKTDEVAGFKAITLDDNRWKYPSIKTTNLLPNIMGLSYAESSNADEAILIKENFVTEGTCSTIFLVKNNCIISPSLHDGILSGITRKIVIELLESNNLKYIEKAVHKNELYDADEIWISNSCDAVIPIINLDSFLINDGKIGPIWKLVYQSYLESFCKDLLNA